MYSFRNYLLETFDIEDEFSAIVNPDIRLMKPDEQEPFAEIVTNSKGKTVLRVGQVLSKGPVLKVR